MNFKIIFFRCILLLLFSFICKNTFGQKTPEIKVDTTWIEFYALGFENPFVKQGIDSLILQYDLLKNMGQDYIYLLSIEKASSNTFLIHIIIMRKYILESSNILGFFRIKEQPFFVRGESIPSLFIKTNYQESFYIRREWVEINQKMQRWDTFNHEEFFPTWILSYEDGKLSLIEEYFIPLFSVGR